MAKQNHAYFSNLSLQTVLRDTFHLVRNMILFCLLYTSDDHIV